MRFAIIDIGYNAIRAAVYESEAAGAPEIFNNKFKNDLLSLLMNDTLEIKHQTYLSIQYFLQIFKNLRVTKIKCVATAVLRDHPRAQEFVEYIQNQYQFKIRIISGIEEAHLTAVGLMHGVSDCRGLAIDLGGGSLELIEVDHGKLGKLKSLDLGTKIISQRQISSRQEIKEILTEQFGTQTYANLYFIGGALRFIGKLYLEFAQYPLRNLHHLSVSTDDFIRYLTKIQNSSELFYEKLSKRRLSINAILLAYAMVELFKPQQIVISTYGLKEGVRHEFTPSTTDLILEKLTYACQYNLHQTDFPAYFKVIEPLLLPDARNIYLLKLAIVASNLKYKLDKTLPNTAIAEFILASEIPFTHPDRVMLALITSYASNYRPTLDLIRASRILLSKTQHDNCQILGHFMRICEEIDGPDYNTPSFAISQRGSYLEIDSHGMLPRNIFEKVCVRLKSIAYVLKR